MGGAERASPLELLNRVLVKGKQCPICRGDYMREAASGWDALPAGTKELRLDEPENVS